MNGERAPACRDDRQRRADVLADATLNGIDYVEVAPLDHRVLRVFFIKPVPPLNPADPSDPQDEYGISADLTRITITGGIKIVGIRATGATRHPDGHLVISVNESGDFSLYTLTIDVPQLDPFLRRAEFSFKASCPVDFDCRVDQECPPKKAAEPLLDYMAKDYASFRRLLLDLLPQLNPRFIERNPADLGIALIELLAHEGDHLSYFQDAVANEAYLDTVRQRISARRHAKLIDYRMHDGRNAWTFIHARVNAPGSLVQGTKTFTRVFEPLSGETSPPAVVVDASKITAEALEQDPALASTAVFETTRPASFDPRNNEIVIHTWGNEECCLRQGASEAFLYSVLPGTNTAVRPVLEKGDYLLFEEVKGPHTGALADADPLHRQVVLIDEEPSVSEDPVYGDALINGALQRRLAAQPALPLLRVRWRRQDVLAFPLCLSSRPPGRELIRNVSVARGNLVPADHGLTFTETITRSQPVPADILFRLPLSRGPLTMQCEPDRVEHDPATVQLTTARDDLSSDVREAKPAVALLVTFPTGSELWTPVPDLLDSPPFAQHFVAEVDNGGRAILRFGDGEYGREVAGATSFQAVYRIGNGRAGNIGAEALAHMALAGPASWIDAVRNPLPARDGMDSETIEEVRQRAPQAFRAKQFRAVTEADYAAAVKELPEVAGAVANFRWTGSWQTVFVGVDARAPADLIREPQGLTRLSTRLERRVRAFLTRFRLAGYDLEIRPPRFVPLEVELELCVAPGHFRGDVAKAVSDALSSRVLLDGGRGFFHPDNFTFGQAVYLSQIYAAIKRVEGVDSVVVTKFRRYRELDNGELANGVMPIGPWEIAQLENDPNFMENGVLRITALGGKA